MADQKDLVLVIDPYDDEREMLVEAALLPFGYDVISASDGHTGLAYAQQEWPDVVVMDLYPGGLSARDVLAALNAQSFENPVVLLADEGAEREALQAFRLGAKDYVIRPFREAELIQVVERGLEEVRLRRERESLIAEVQQAAQVAQRHLAEMQILNAIGKSITSLRNLNDIFNQLIQAAMYITKAESAGFFLRDDNSNRLILRAGKNLVPDLANRMGQPIEDDLANLVMSSRETYVASGEGLDRFSPAQTGARSVIYAPLVVSDSSLGLIWVANRRAPFARHMDEIMTALADYAAIAVVNARLLANMQDQAQRAQEEARQQMANAAAAMPDHRFEEFARDIRQPITHLLGNMNMFRTGQMGRLTSSHQAAVDVMYRQLSELVELIDQYVPPDTGGL